MDFTKKHKDFFKVDGTEVSLLDTRYQSIPVEQFDAELSQLESVASQTSSVVMDGIDADAALAARLQEEERAASSPSTSSPAKVTTGGEEEWKTSGKKKNKSRKQKNKEKGKAAAVVAAGASPQQKSGSATTSQSNPSPQKSSPSPTTQTEAETNSDKNDTQSSEALAAEAEEATQIEILAQELLNVFHGPFFCFNDSEVRPIHITDLSSSFEGRSSAYLLIYRQVHEAPYSADQDEMAVSGPLSAEALTLPMHPPSLWREQVEARNAELSVKRVEFENYMHSVKLKVYFPVHFTSSWPCLTLTSPEDLVSMGSIPSELARGLEVECDISKGVKMLREDIISKALTALQSVDLSTVLGLNGGEDDDIMISKLVPLSESQKPGLRPLYSMCPALSASDTVGDALAHNTSVVLWTTLHLPDRSGDIEPLSEAPRNLRVAFKSETSGGMEKKDVYLPLTSSMADLCRVAAECVGLDLPRVQIHSLEERKIIYNTKHSGGKLKEWYATPLWKSGALTKPFALQNQRYRQMEWNEVLVENVGNARPSTMGLASKEIIRRNRLRTIRVELDVGGSTLTRLRKDYAKGGLMCTDEIGASIPTEDAMEVENVCDDVDDLASTTVKVTSYYDEFKNNM